MTREEELHQLMQSLYRRSGEATGYWPNYFLRDVRRNGGLAVAKKLLLPGQVSSGFDRLVRVRRADLSVETIALSERFRHLFSEAELAEAEHRLSQLPASAFPARVARDGLPEEVDDPTTVPEGSVKRVVVNQYERSAKARAACIRHHGNRCSVCDLDFE